MPPDSRQSDRGRTEVRVFPTPAEACQAVAAEVARAVVSGPGARTVLGLPTGSSPIGVYAELVKLHRAGLSFARVVSFNLDEYHPVLPTAPASFHRFMREHLFDHVDLPGDAWHVPDGTVPESQVESHCRGYEAQIVRAGGIDLLICGLGRTGHIGFNEPGSGRDSRTRRVALHAVTLEDNRARFGGGTIPTHAITMGVGTILEARRIVLLAVGEAKAEPLARALNGPVTAVLPASFLQEHAGVTVFADRAAAAALGSPGPR